MPARLHLYWPFAALVLVIAGWCLWWWLAASEVERQILAWREADGAQSLNFDSLALSGFPFRIEATLTGASTKGPSGLYAAERFRAIVQPLNFDHWIFEAAGHQSLILRDDQGRNWALKGEARTTRASLLLKAGAPIRFDVDLTGFEGRLWDADNVERKLAAGRAQVHVRTPMDAPTPQIDVAIKADRLILGEGFDALLGPEIGLAELRARLEKASPAILNTPDAWRAWAQTGGRMGIDALSLRWGEVDIRAEKGALALDPGGRPEGSLDARVGGHRQLIEALIANGRISARDGEVTAQVLSMLAAAGGDDEGRVRMPLTFREGALFVGPQRITALPPLL